MTFAQIIEYVKKGIFTLLGLFLALYLFVILLTYSANDPSWSHISSDMTHINNMGGAMGAWLSDLLYVFFGWASWWILVFLIYETVLVWWESRTTFGLLRVIAYVFLLLAGSALCAQLTGWFQEPATIASDVHIGGGVIGHELSQRLAILLTSIGSWIFLVLFSLITITFAFNMRWRRLYQTVTDRTWLGSGLKPHESAHTIPAYHEANTKQHLLIHGKATDVDNNYEDESSSIAVSTDGEENLNEAADPLATNAEHSEQLPHRSYAPIVKELYKDSPEADRQGHLDFETDEGSHSSGFTDVLNEFLVKSGLGAALQQQLQAEQEREQSQSSSMIASQKQAGGESSQVSIKPASTETQKQKVEPRFEWNDESAVSSLLSATPSASPAMTDQLQSSVQGSTTIAPTRQPVVDSASVSAQAPPESESDTVSSETAASLPAAKQDEDKARSADIVKATDPNEDPADTNAESENYDQTAAAPMATPEVNVDKLVDSWLASSESQALTAKWEADQPTLEGASKPDSASSFTDFLKDKRDSDTPLSATATSAKSDTKPDDARSQPVTNSSITGVDLTPSNTPPANPKEPPKAVTDTTAEADSNHSRISFSVAQGDASNHIEDMTADHDEVTNQVSLPGIEDDAAFATQSRAMQTAKYRESLTPIPELSILDKPDPDRKPSYTEVELEKLSELLEIKLQDFNVKAEVVNAIPGPVVTRFEVELAAGVKASKVTGISRDLARSLSMASLRVVEVIPGKPYIGIEVPNKKREMVRLIELLNTDKYQDPKAQISMAMGKDIGGNPIITDLAKAPHMLVAGTTGSGKSVLVNSMLLSMLLKYKPDELRMILIDPKQLELANYNDIPHLLTPVVTDMNEAASSLSWCVAEMERRYQLMSLLKVRKLGEFNKKVLAAQEAGKPMIDPLWRPNDSVSMDQAPKLKTLPMIVIVADEFADMIMQVGKQAEELITRLAQKSRAAGIHLMLATQRPSVDVITGLIKANIPVRAALRVNSKVDSRTILDSGGAEDMLGNGDMLFLGPGQIEPDRVHGAYVSDEEVNRVCDAWRERGAPDYIDNMASNFELSSPGGSGGNTSGEDDKLYDEAVAFVMETRKVSASSIQRKFSIGYNRAARIVDSMEEAGLVSAMGKSGKRELLM